MPDLHAQLHRSLGESLLGVYVCGSLVTGDFDARLSDVDLVAALQRTPSEEDVSTLRSLHADLIGRHPEWTDRVEVIYVHATDLQTFKIEPPRIAKVSPGEPLQLFEASGAFLMNWYLLRESGLALCGPPVSDLVADVSREEFVTQSRAALRSAHNWLKRPLREGSEAYIVLTSCRGLHTVLEHGEVSKNRAATWAITAFPQWAALIQKCLYWRSRMHQPSPLRPASLEALAFAEFAAKCVGAPP